MRKVDMTKIEIPETIIKDYLDHAAKEYPWECCGFLIGTYTQTGGLAEKYLPADNVKEGEKERRFIIDPTAYQRAEDAADEEGKSVIGIVHSHPDHPDIPSEFDRTHAWPGFSYIIISVPKGKPARYRSWQLETGREKFIEERIVILKEAIHYTSSKTRSTE